jgi:hypothetical protein
MVAPFKSMASDAATFTGDLVDMIKRFSEGTTSFALVGAGPLNRPYTKNRRIFDALYPLRNRHFSHQLGPFENKLFFVLTIPYEGGEWEVFDD